MRSVASRAAAAEAGPVVRAVRFVESSEGMSVSRVEFLLLGDNDGGDDPDASRAAVFPLEAPHEYVVCVRFNEQDGLLVGAQVQTNLGRRSAFFQAATAAPSNAHRRELYAVEGEAVVGFSRSMADASTFEVRGAPKPFVRRKKLRKLLLLPNVRSLLLTAKTGRSTAGHMLKGGRKAVALHAVRHGLAGRMLSPGAEGDALVRLLLDGEDKVAAAAKESTMSRVARRVSSVMSMTSRATTKPRDEEGDDRSSGDDLDSAEDDDDESVGFPPSLLRALCEPGSNFEHSLMDLLSEGRARDGRPPLMRILFEAGVAKVIFARSKLHKKCLAEMIFTPDRTRGLRSFMQLMTDDEALNDPNRPSLLRSMLVGESSGSKPSVIRLMFLRPATRALTSVMDELLKGDSNLPEGCCVRRMLTETDERPVSLARLFFSDTATGKPALAKYVFGGETESDKRPSLMRLMVQGEAREQNSLLRLLVGFRGANGDYSLLDLFTLNSPSLMDILLKGEASASESSLGRLMLGTTLTIQNGRLRMGSALGAAADKSVSAVLSKTSIEVDEHQKEAEALLQRRLKRGVTIAKACMLGEEDGGPGISFMRVLLMGEEQGLSILRLLMFGEDKGEVSPLRIIFTGMHAAFVAAQSVAGSSKDVLERPESLLDLATQPRKWAEVLQRVSASVIEAVQESHQSGSTWRESFDKLVALGKKNLQSRDAWEHNLAFLYTAFARIRSMGPEFASKWKKQWLIVSREIRLTGERVESQSVWKNLAPVVAILTESIAEQQWQKVFVNAAHVLQAIEAAASGAASASPDNPLSKALHVVEDIISWAPRWF